MTARRVFVYLLAGCGLLACWPAPAEPETGAGALTPGEAFHCALKKSETIAMKTQELYIAQGHFYQALDVVMPKLNFVMTRSEQDASKDSASSDGVGGSLTRRTTPQKKFVFSQPIFSGFKEFAAIQGAGAEKSQRRNEIRRAKELLFVDVMEAFYNLAQAREEIAIRTLTKETLQKRVTELEERIRLGRSRENDGQTALAEIKLSEAQLVGARRFEAVSRELLEFYIGKKIEGALVDEPAPDNVQPLEMFLERAQDRSDVRAAEDAYYLKEKGVTVAQADLFPSVKLDGNYYTERVGFQSGIDWDVLLTVDVPLFEGTETFGNIKVAAAEKDREKYNLLLVQRQATLEVRTAYEEYVASHQEAAAYAEAAEAMKKSYELEENDYRLNLVNNLDVLDALRRFEDTRSTYNEAFYNARRNFWKLQASAGEVPFLADRNP